MLTSNIAHTAVGDTLTLAGTQTLNLPFANTDTNQTILSGATVNLGTNTSLGSGTLTAISGTIESTTLAVTLANPVVFGGSTVTFAGGFGITLSGAATDQNGSTIAVNLLSVAINKPTFANNAAATIAGSQFLILGVVAGSPLTLNGANTLTMSNTSTNFFIVSNIANTAPTDTLTIAGTGQLLNLPNANTSQRPAPSSTARS